MKKILGIILGVLICIGGFYCLFAPGLTFSSLSIIFAIVLIESAIAYFIMWIEVKKLGGKNGLMIFNAILCLIGGIGLLTNSFTQLVFDEMVLIIVAILMIAGGISRIAHSFDVKKYLPSAPWALELVCGILITIAGILSIVNPVILAGAIGIKMAINILTIGISLIALSFSIK